MFMPPVTLSAGESLELDSPYRQLFQDGGLDLRAVCTDLFVREQVGFTLDYRAARPSCEYLHGGDVLILHASVVHDALGHAPGEVEFDASVAQFVDSFGLCVQRWVHPSR